MNDKEYRQQKNRLIALRDKWYKRLGLGWWCVELEYCRDGLPDPPNNDSEQFQTIFKTYAKWEYRKGLIKCNMPAIAELSNDDLEEMWVHECMHLIVNEMRESGDNWLKHEESVCTALARAFIWTAQDIEKVLSKKTIIKSK